QRMVARAAFMNEMHAKAVHVRAEVREPVHGVFLPPPVKAIGPMIDERTQLVSVHAKGPAVRDLIGPPSPAQAILKVAQHGLSRVDPKRMGCHGSAPRDGGDARSPPWEPKRPDCQEGCVSEETRDRDCAASPINFRSSSRARSVEMDWISFSDSRK